LQEQKITKSQNECRANKSKQPLQPPAQKHSTKISKTNFHNHTHNRNKKLTMNRYFQEKKKIKNQSQEKTEKTTKKQMHDRTRESTQPRFSGKKNN
jgi:hypothetical protein